MNHYLKYIVAGIFLIFSTVTLAYEPSTHSILTGMAVKRSVLYTDSSLLNDLRLSQSSQIYTPRTGGGPLSMSDIIQYGSRDEDEHYATMAFQHFYDPQYNHFIGRPLTVGGALGHMSPDWALEDKEELLGSAVGGWIPQNYSFRNAQQYFFRSLTEQSAGDRRNHFSKVFESLGHVLHHIQDMAQPQHTRNDQHLPIPIPGANWGFYERYTQSIESQIPYRAGINSYPIPKIFGTARQFWHTPNTTIPRFLGMAEFSSQNYVSFGSNYQGAKSFDGQLDTVTNHPEFPLPNGINHDGTAKYIKEEFATLTLDNGSTYSGYVDFVKGKIYDELTGTSPTYRLASPSVFNPYLSFKNKSFRVFTENSLVFEDNYKILLPRAVSFSAGLINHFFRGRLNLRKNPSGSGWLVDNVSPHLKNGGFYLYYEDAAGTRQFASGFRASLAAGQSVAVNYGEPPQGTVRMVVAFIGQIGEEGNPSVGASWYATAGKVIDYSPPPPPPEIVIVGASAINGQPNSQRAFRWSSKTGVRNLGVGAGALTSEAFGISANGQVVVGITTGYKAIYCEACTNPWSGTNPGPTSTILNVAVRWSGNYVAYYLNGSASTYSAAWSANADGSQIYGEGLVPNAGVKSFRWNLYRYEQIYTTSGVFSKNPLNSADGTIVLTRVNNRAAYIKGGKTHIIPLPSGHDWSVANHVIVIP